MSKKAAAEGASRGGVATLVKVETEGERSHDIQNYLQTFNKEIEGGSEVIRDGNTYYVDTNGQFYCSQRVICVAPGENGTEVMETVEGNQDSLSASTSGEVQAVTLTGDGEPVLLNAGGAYGTVTLVPQENNGEVSYVLFMPSHAQTKQEHETDVNQTLEDEEGEEAEGDEEMEDQDLTVYDFDEEAAPNDQTQDSEVEEEKPKMVKIMHKKSLQAIATAHMCNYCNYTSSKRYLLSRHMKSHSEERPHKCSLCERGFKTLSSLQNHVNTHTGTKPHQCRFCDSTFTTSGELVRHVRYKHTHEKPHRCSECDYASVELSKLKRHVRCHTGERPYQCPHCTYASPDTFKLKRHLRIHTGEKPYQCDICHSRFTQSNSLKAHKLIHSVADKPVFRCELCPATCGRKTDLRIHVQKLHTSDRLLKCTRCGATFPDRYSYRVHSKTHEGEKCYRCGLCPYASTSARHLESHMLIHTDQKPYACDMCDQSFRQKQLLKRHQNLYHTPDYIPPPPREKTHECPECGRPFRHKGNLMRHLAVHDPDSPNHEKALALKIGRQKKVHFVDGQQVELVDEDEEVGDSGVVMSDSNGQPYVVLEVIQLPDGSGTEFVMASEGEDLGDVKGSSLELSETDPLAIETEGIDNSLDDEKKLIKVERREKKPEGITNCFGFGEDDEDDEVEDVEAEDDELDDK